MNKVETIIQNIKNMAQEEPIIKTNEVKMLRKGMLLAMEIFEQQLKSMEECN